MDIDYVYTKVRRSFGRQYFFCEEGPKIVEDIKPDKTQMSNYIYKNPVHKGTQFGYVMSENVANTQVIDFTDHGMNHLEGGWPKEIDTNDEEAVLRFKKKVERLDNYVLAMKHLTGPMEHAILQNNAVNIYEEYFVQKDSATPVEKTSCRIQNLFRDPQEVKRPITHCSWSPYGTEFSVSHCNMNFQRMSSEQSLASYVWDIENPNTPLLTLEGKVPIVTLEYNPRDFYILVGGLYNGQVAEFDVRKGPNPINLNVLETGHRDPVHSVIWISSKSGMEFFSTSSDGVVKWWDCRKLEEPVDQIILDLVKSEKPNIVKSHGASCLEYEPSIPVKYFVGTESGYVICGNRKGTNQQEKLPWMMKAHFGPIYSIHRNQAFNKNYLTVGDWTARIWSEDCKESAIMWTDYHKVRLTAGEWSGSRYSVFFLTREDGYLDLWDVLQKQNEALLSFKISNEPLTALRVREDGELVLVANSSGTAYVVRYSSNLAESSKNDKIFLSAMFDRESRREKLLETRNKEIRLKLREIALAKEALENQEEEEVPKTEFETAIDNYKESLEKDYLAAIVAILEDFDKRKEGNKELPPLPPSPIEQEEVAQKVEEDTEEENV